MWEWKGWFMSEKCILLYQESYWFSFVSDWERIYKIPFALVWKRKWKGQWCTESECETFPLLGWLCVPGITSAEGEQIMFSELLSRS